MSRGPEVDLLGVGAGELVDEDERGAVLAAARHPDGAVTIVEICVKVEGIRSTNMQDK